MEFEILISSFHSPITDFPSGYVIVPIPFRVFSENPPLYNFPLGYFNIPFPYLCPSFHSPT